MSTLREIPFFNYKALFAQREREYLNVVSDVLSRGAYIMQRDLIEFEEHLASYLGIKHAIGTADGTMALLTSLMAAGVKSGDEVIVPSHTFVASAAAIHHAGAVPVLVDCDNDHLIDVVSMENAITNRTKAIMPVQLNGRVADMSKVMSIANDNNLLVIEDSCQALGAKFNDRFAGSFGLAGAFSFFPAKTLGCFGDAGAVVTESDEIAEKVRMIRDHGRNHSNGKVEMFGYNARLDNLQAAILNLKLKYYDEDIARRREIAAIYQEKLCAIDVLLLPPAPNSDPLHYDIYQNYEIEAKNRDDLREFLTARGVGTILQWGGHAIHQFNQLGLNGDLPKTDRMTERFMLLPMHPMLTDEDIIYICNQIIEFYSV